MMHYRLHFICCVLLSVLSLSVMAQSREGARRQMNSGNYSNAVTLLSALDELYPGQYTKDLTTAKRCLSLQRSAKAKFASKQYAEAEELYKQILKLNPSDKTVNQSILQCQQERDKYLTAELEKCKSISDYRSFASKYPNTSQARIASAKVNEYDREQQDKTAWNDAVKNGSISAYTKYISRSNSTSKHVGEAYISRARLYFEQAQNAYSEESARIYFSMAKDDYDKATEKKSILTHIDDTKYLICTAEEKFHELGNQPAYPEVSSYLSWAEAYLSNTAVYPHLHMKEANALMINALLTLGYFKDAREFVDSHYGEITCSVFTLSSSKEWTRKEWNTYIKQREKNSRYNNHKTVTNNASTTPLLTLWELGASYAASGSHESYIGLIVSFSLGTHDNRFNWVFSASPCFLVKRNTQYDSELPDFMLPITTGPRLNIIRSAPYGFYLSAQPEIGYCIGASGVYGGKLNIGYNMVGIGLEALWNMKKMSVDSNFSTNILYLGVGATVNF